MATNNYNPNTGAKLKKGESVTVKGTNTKVTQGTTFSGGGSSAPAYNSSGTNTGTPSAEYNTYLKSLNKKGDPNYVPTPDDAGFSPVTPEKTPTGVDIPPTAPTQAQVQQPNAQQTNEFNNLTGERLAPGSSYVNAQGMTVQQGSPYKQALAGLQSMGAAPSDAGAARGAVTGAVAQYTEPDTTAIDTFLGEDANTTSLMQSITELLNPSKQTTSLVQDYQSLYKQSGLDEINAELIDAETVINGTEDDIRNEIQTAGGFGTDSQVQAMALARNKSLLVRYNQLAQMKTDATNQLNTLSQLNMQDKQMAQTKLNSQISAMFNLADFAQKAQNNTREQAQWLTQTMGADGLYNAYKNDPRQLGFLEKTLGLAPGGMAVVAAQAAQTRATAQEKDLLQLDTLRSGLKTDALQRENLRSQINERDNAVNTSGTISGKPQNATQSAANSYANRLNEANVVLSTLSKKFASPFARGGTTILGFGVPNTLKSGDRQSYEQAQNNFVTAVLRRESGASIAPTEFDTASKIYFAQPGDTDATVAQKDATRNTVINNLYREADVLRPVLPGQVIESDGKKYKVGMDGVTLEQI
jgi:hypothetical protein